MELPPACSDDVAARSQAAYDRLAQEYYDPQRHPTCENFGAIQDSLLPYLQSFVTSSGPFVEVGCGRGRVDLIVGDQRAILTDISGSMLQLARARTRGVVRCESMDVFRPHLGRQSADGVFAFMADAYNHADFLAAAALLVRPGGLLVMTLPNHQWAATVRNALNIPLDQTTFFVGGADPVACPSMTRSIAEQCVLLESTGFRPVATKTYALELTTATPSHHVQLASRLLDVPPKAVPLVDLYVATLAG